MQIKSNLKAATFATGRGIKKAAVVTVNTDLATIGKGVATGTKATGRGIKALSYDAPKGKLAVRKAAKAEARMAKGETLVSFLIAESHRFTV